MNKTQRLLQSNNAPQDRMLESQASVLSYYRGEGCGNTFLIFDCIDHSEEVGVEVIQEAYKWLIKENRDDALILKREYRDEKKLVLTMLVLEPDQSIAEFCGNGARVVSCYLQQKYGNQTMEYYLKTSQGMRKIWWDNDVYFVEMGKTIVRSSSNKFITSNFETFNLGMGMRQFTFFWTETMEPHFVTFDVIEEEELRDLGLYINQNQRHFFPLGVNLNRAEVLTDNRLRVTTFERGVNRITAACGTGATSSVMLARATGRIQENECVAVILKEGSITIHPKEECSVMSGPATVEAVTC